MNDMKYYRKKPVVVKAYQTDEDRVVHTLEGDMLAKAGSYIITGVRGEIYPCRQDIFEETYEEVDNTYYTRDTVIKCDECFYNKGIALSGRVMCDNWKTEVDGSGCFYGKEKG